MTGSIAGVLDVITGEPATTVFSSDFDGTLAAIVEDPTTARPEPDVARSLVELASAFQRVAVISGRPVGFLRACLGEEVAAACSLFGRYGAEVLARDGSMLTLDGDAGLGPAVERLRRGAAAIDPRVLVEDKVGSVALHWRVVPALEGAVRALAEAEASTSGLEIREGKMLVDLVRPGAPTKGSTIDRLIEKSTRTCCFIGDDVGDLDGFDALDRFQLAGGIAVRVAVSSEGMPKALADRADLVLAGPDAAASFLSVVAARIREA